jgi:hypothetical protein
LSLGREMVYVLSGGYSVQTTTCGASATFSPARCGPRRTNQPPNPMILLHHMLLRSQRVPRVLWTEEAKHKLRAVHDRAKSAALQRGGEEVSCLSGPVHMIGSGVSLCHCLPSFGLSAHCSPCPADFAYEVSAGIRPEGVGTPHQGSCHAPNLPHSPVLCLPRPHPCSSTEAGWPRNRSPLPQLVCSRHHAPVSWYEGCPNDREHCRFSGLLWPARLVGVTRRNTLDRPCAWGSHYTVETTPVVQ